MRALYLLIFTGIAASFTPPGLFRNIPPPLDHYRDLYKQRTMSASQEVDAVLLSDILPKARSINIFASLTRDVSTVDSRLSSSQNATVLAPLNSAMQALPRKPWEDSENDRSGVSALRNEEKAAQNIQKFVEEHVVPQSPWDGSKIATMGGEEIWWEERSGTRYIMPGNIEVSEVLGKTVNGEVWSLQGVINYKS